jgi:signal transduction histidine kinase
MKQVLLYKYGRWVLLVCGLGLLTVLLFYMHDTPVADDVLEMKHAEFSQQPGSDLPTNDVPWVQTPLPDIWWSHPHPQREGWYRIKLTLNVPPNRLWGIYLASVSLNAAVYLNNELLGTGGRFSDPVARNWNRPLYFAIPNGLLRPGDNTLLVRVKTDPPQHGLLAKVYLGPAESLIPIYEQRKLVRYEFSQIIVVMLFVSSGFLLVLWYRRRSDTVYLWFALSILAWAIHSLNLIVINIPVSMRQWGWLYSSSIMWTPICASIFVRRLLGHAAARHERIILLAGALASVLLGVIPENVFNRYGVQVAAAFTLLLSVYPVAFALWYFIKTRSGDIFMLMASGAWMLMLGVYDNLIISHIIIREYNLVLQYSAPPILFVFVSILLKRFVSSISESEKLNTELGSRIKAKHQELEANFTKMRTLEHQQVLTAERERILRDMHDGMGGYLISTLALVDKGVTDNTLLRGALQHALDDLRLMIDSMEDVGGDVLAVLGMLRQRLEPRLVQAGITLRWHVQTLPPLENFGPQKALHVMRILQEGFTNIIKHAQARTITLSTGHALNANEKAGVFIQLCDDGVGYCVESNTPGRGLLNMQRRAAMIGGHYTAHSNANGSCVHLWLPCGG